MNTEKEVVQHKSYEIEITMKVTGPQREYPYTATIGEVTNKKRICCPAVDVRAESTKVLRQAVANFSESLVSGIKPIIDSEPKVLNDDREDKALEV